LGCCCVDELVYVAAEFSGLQIVEVSDPGNIEVVGYWDGNPGYAQDDSVSGSYA